MRIVVGLVLLAAIACSDGAEVTGGSPTAPPRATEPARAPSALAEAVTVDFGGPRVVAEVAATADERRRGLMGREELAADAGMLFLFDEPTSGGFWMKDTLLPLSIAFLRDAGSETFEVVAILDMEPCEADPCRIYEPGVSYDAALEVNQGWFAEMGVEVGDEATVDTPSR